MCCVCSDGGEVTVESHIEDYCSSCCDGSYLNDVGFYQPNTRYACEVDLPCSSGWSLYVDDGSEGRDSCVKTENVTSQQWSDAAAACPTTSHMLSVTSAQGMLVTTGLMPFVGNALTAPAYVGCSQDSGATQVNAGWSWADGTNASNLNCVGGVAGTPCGVWGTGQPK